MLEYFKSLLSTGKGSVELIVICLYVGILIASCIALYDRRTLGSFIRALVAANATKASVDEVWQAESFIRHQVRDSRHQMLLCERLQDVAENPCVRYGVIDLGAIGERRRGLLPTGASVADVINFISELSTHHGMLLRNPNAANGLIGAFYARSFDLEEMYPHSRAADQYYLQGIDFGERPRG